MNLKVFLRGANLQKADRTVIFSIFSSVCCEQKKERECMQLRIAVLRSELQRQRKALGREIDLRQKERSQLRKKGKVKNCLFSRLLSANVINTILLLYVVSVWWFQLFFASCTHTHNVMSIGMAQSYIKICFVISHIQIKLYCASITI